MVAAVVYAAGSSPIHFWPFAVVWLALLLDTWRSVRAREKNATTSPVKRTTNARTITKAAPRWLPAETMAFGI